MYECDTAVDAKDFSGDVPRGRAREPGDTLGHVSGVRRTPGERAPCQTCARGIHVRRTDGARDSVGGDESRAHAVHEHAVAAELERKISDDGLQGGFCDSGDVVMGQGAP
jgi:hypothetical protein